MKDLKCLANILYNIGLTIDMIPEKMHPDRSEQQTQVVMWAAILMPLVKLVLIPQKFLKYLGHVKNNETWKW